MDSYTTDQSVDYSQTLRVIGQVLESLKPEAFDVVCHSGFYLIRCLTRQRKRGLLTILRKWREENLLRAGPGSKPFMNVELLYSHQEIQSLDEQGKARRRDPRGMPDPFSLSSILRATGDFVNPKGRFVLASRRDHQVVVLYETAEGLRKVEEYPLSSFYDFWVAMYLKRKQDSSPGPKI